MKFKRLSIGTFGLLAVGGLVCGCSGKATDCNANKSCGDYGGAAGSSAAGASGVGGSSGHGGMSGGSGAAGASGAAGTGTPVCNPSANPAAEACVISNEYGLFVAPGGTNTGNGTREKPFPSLSKALEVAGAGALKRIYVCAAPYTESDTLVIPNRVEIYGGFDCSDWSYAVNVNQRAFITSSKSVAAMVEAAKLGVILQDMRLDASDAPANSSGSSSFGLMINDSSALLERVEIRAGKATAGKDGDAGVMGAPGTDSSATQNGSAACAAMPAEGTAVAQSMCGSKGGKGGVGFLSLDGAPGTSGFPSSFVSTPEQMNGGAGAKQVGPAVFGQDGSLGYPGNPGSHGASAPSIGSFSAQSFTIASGGNGSDGHTGQGGGGGGASKGNGACTGASGAAGGMGGCGGTAATGGSGGGASIAVLSWNSAITLDACSLIASDGGAGGRGGAAGAGGPGKDGGKGGSGNANIGDAGKGGKGGYGGRGGSGAGGSGGPSIALFYSGSVPILMNAPTLTASPTKAAKGAGGQVDLTDPDSKAPDGSVGITAAMYTPPVKI